MNGSLFSPYDERLYLMMRASETRDFMRLIGLQLERRDPTFVPAARVANLRAAMGLTGKAGLERWQRRLACWSRPGMQLVQVDDDGSLLVTYLLENDEGEETATLAWPSPEAGSQNGFANGPRQPKRQYSTNPRAVAARDKYHAEKALEEGPRAESLTPRESKPDTSASENLSETMSETASETGQVSRAHVRDVNTYPEDNCKLSLPDTLNVAGQEKSAKPAPPKLPPVPENLRPQDVSTAKQAAVTSIMRDCGDAPKWRSAWLALWQHCYEHKCLRVWNEAILALEKCLRSGTPIKKRGPWLRGTMRAMLDQAGHAYEPPISAPPEEPLDAAEVAEIKAQAEEARKFLTQGMGGSTDAAA